MSGLKFDCYLRGEFYCVVIARCATHALNLAHAKLGGHPDNGRLVIIRSDERGDSVAEARELSRGLFSESH